MSTIAVLIAELNVYLLLQHEKNIKRAITKHAGLPLIISSKHDAQTESKYIYTIMQVVHDNRSKNKTKSGY